MNGNFRHIIACFIITVFYLETTLSFSVLRIDFFTETAAIELVNDMEPGNNGKEAGETVTEKSFLQPNDLCPGYLTTAENAGPKRYVDFHADIRGSFLSVFTPPPKICSLF